MKIFISSLVLFLLFSPIAVLGTSHNTGFPDSGSVGSPSSGNVGQPYSGGDNVKLANPLGKVSSFPQLIEVVLNALFIIGVPVAVFFVVLAGARFVLARGNPTKITQARNNLLWTIVGIAVFFGAVLITKVIVGTLQRLGVNI